MSPINNRPIRTQSLRLQVYDALRERLQRGDIKPADRLLDLEIAADLGISRMPVREALLQLTHEGYLVGTTRGFMLPTLTFEDMNEIFDIRKLLEPRAAAMAARDIQDEQLEQLAAAVRLAETSHHEGNAEQFIVANSDFRLGWLQAVANRRLAAIIKRFADHVQTVRFDTLQVAATRQIALNGLTELLPLFQRRDVLGTQERMERFIISSQEAFIAARYSAPSDPKPAQTPPNAHSDHEQRPRPGVTATA